MPDASPADSLLAVQHEGRRRFLELVADLRPELHRYCARMTGSVADGEDIVQETLARAYYLLPEMNQMPAFRPWLFRIAHNRALDHLRRYEARMSEPLDAGSTIDSFRFRTCDSVQPGASWRQNRFDLLGQLVKGLNFERSAQPAVENGKIAFRFRVSAEVDFLNARTAASGMFSQGSDCPELTALRRRESPSVSHDVFSTIIR